jgi:two-component system, NarL family, nitrate/nitrite response regulator NarL
LAEGELGGTGEPPIGPEAPVSVLVVDDQELFRAVLRDVVSATPDMTLVGEAASGEAAVDAVEKLSPQLVVMDKRMPGIGGIEAAQRIRARRPEIVVVLVSVELPDPELLNASGAVAFLPKRQLSPRALAELWQTYGA